MKLELINEQGVYMPLDLFDDFEIMYNHQFESYKEIGSNSMPYTSKFKIPLNDNNRNVCGVHFDATYPSRQSIDGRALYNDGTVAFYFIADIESQVINVLQPYIEISIIDKISKALSDLAKFKMSDLLKGNKFSLKDETWMFDTKYGIDAGHPTPHPDRFYLFPYINFNNKSSIFSSDPKRGISQLQPAFPINKLLKKIFEYVNVDIKSTFLFQGGEISQDILVGDTALILPTKLMTTDNYPLNLDTYITGGANIGANKFIERQPGIPNKMSTSSRIAVHDFMTQTTCGKPITFVYDKLSDVSTYGKKGRFCSTVDGKCTMTIRKANPAEKMYAIIGSITKHEAGVSSSIFSLNEPTNPPEFDIKIADTDFMNNTLGGIFNYDQNWEEGKTFDVKTAKTVGVARYAGKTSSGRGLKYEYDFFDETIVEMDFKANQDIELSFVLAPRNGVDKTTLAYTGKIAGDSGSSTYSFELDVLNGFYEYRLISGGETYPDNLLNLCKLPVSIPKGDSACQVTIEFDFKEAIPFPTGYKGFDCDSDNHGDNVFIPPHLVDMGESMKSVKDYKLLDVVKMIMERFNLKLFTKSDSSIHIDTETNMMSQGALMTEELFIIDHLIDESVNIEFLSSEYGVVSVSDNNPSFYENDFNKLDKLSIDSDKREEISLRFKSSIINKRMFEDKYDDSSYNLLKYFNSTDRWGIADRRQVKPNELKPAFCILKDSVDMPVFFPMTHCDYSSRLSYGEDDDKHYLDVGFYNWFYYFKSIHPSMKVEAANISSDNFDFVSFENGKFKANTTTLFKKFWNTYINDMINGKSVRMNLDIYVSEKDFKRLLNFPTIMFKGQRWKLKGFDKYNLESFNGSICNLKLIKEKVWS